ncbi:RimJ/RimL family protein N-acetyltransferase [Actinomadura coerulea]|uniref:RimJ/RimL family protein N-acetyltransferase n=1 Tax=Actinomadura coerulea TaxID=46159 RepID=A0A7X0L1X7_9ACTN|nr:GNAT family N-acetyltransferase [Actinomadura coerulea]MBB6398644.1 RimJ/RimL family protein N-acetyltransferase [Actinomadura coerulea]GGQ00401.1 hypothetical protein GCM10010187_15210 [Actinomadura coerulea]
MTADDDGRERDLTSPPGSAAVRLVPLPPAALTALLSGDMAQADAIAGVALPGYFLDSTLRRVWRLHRDRLVVMPDSAPWSVHVAVVECEDIAVGHGGFHGPPDEDGRVEVGYSVAPTHRRRGYAKAIMAELMRRAAEHHAVRLVRATIAPDNAASLRTIAGYGFSRVATHVNAQGRPECIFEAPALAR